MSGGRRSYEWLTGHYVFRSAKRIARRVVRERASAAKIGWAVAIGIVIGLTPFWGFHLPICLVVAALLELNPALTYLAAGISIPPVLPILIFANVQVGTFVTTGNFLGLAFGRFTEMDPFDFARSWLLGGLIVGTAIGAPVGLVAYGAVRAYRVRFPVEPDPIAFAIERVTARYRNLGRMISGWVKGKLEHDPVYRQLAERMPLPGPLIDIGCGNGQTVMLLRELDPGLAAVGLDWDESKLVRARAVTADSEAARFVTGDIRNFELPAVGTLLFVDVLHYSPPAVQDAMLRRAAAALNPGGRIYIRDVDTKAGPRSTYTIWWERLVCALGHHRSDHLTFRHAAEYVGVLEAEGLTATVVESPSDIVLANLLIEARKPVAARRAL